MSTGTLSYLDYVRIKFGSEKLKEAFRNAGENTAKLINDESLMFCTLFVLIPEIHLLDLYQELCPRNITAVKFCSKILKGNMPNINQTEDNEADTLRWILSTGYADDGFSNKYDAIMDGAASLLINVHNDKKALPVIADLIFARNRKGRYIHDLVWVFFQSQDPYTLEIIVPYLKSKNNEDVKLANKLLNLSDDDNISSNRKKLYKSTVGWVRENAPYINFTGENFLYTSNPKPYSINSEAKYLGKNAVTESYSEEECKCLECFNHAEREDKKILSEFSNKIRKRDMNMWSKWMSLPIEEQLSIAKRGLRR